MWLMYRGAHELASGSQRLACSFCKMVFTGCVSYRTYVFFLTISCQYEQLHIVYGILQKSMQFQIHLYL